MSGIPHIADAVHRIKGVYLEVPGTRLTVEDASRLSGLEAATCVLVLTTLEQAGFLRRGTGGVFVRKETH
jgi:hypothetical protein